MNKVSFPGRGATRKNRWATTVFLRLHRTTTSDHSLTTGQLNNCVLTPVSWILHRLRSDLRDEYLEGHSGD